MNAQQRMKLLELHKMSVKTLERFLIGDGKAYEHHDAEDAFVDYLLSLPEDEVTK